METEIEIKILDIDVEKFRKKLEELGAEKKGEYDQRRYVYDIDPKDDTTWIRLRQKGEKIDLTIKKIENDSIDVTKELSVKVDDFEKTNKLLEALGFVAKAYQENKRESYRLNGAKIEIDSWPKIPPYVEVEADSKEKVEAMVKKLGFEMSDTTSISVTAVYEKNGINIHEFKELKF